MGMAKKKIFISREKEIKISFFYQKHKIRIRQLYFENYFMGLENNWIF
jgi:hypothetical protein